MKSFLNKRPDTHHAAKVPCPLYSLCHSKSRTYFVHLLERNPFSQLFGLGPLAQPNFLDL